MSKHAAMRQPPPARMAAEMASSPGQPVRSPPNPQAAQGGTHGGAAIPRTLAGEISRMLAALATR